MPQTNLYDKTGKNVGSVELSDRSSSRPRSTPPSSTRS